MAKRVSKKKITEPPDTPALLADFGRLSQTLREQSATAVFPGLPVLKNESEQTRPLRVCILTQDFVGPVRNGGIGTAYRYLADFLVEQGHEVTVLYASGRHCEKGKIGDWVQFYGERNIKFVPMPKAKVPATEGPLGQAGRVSYTAYEWLKSRDFDLVHVSEWRAIGYYSLIAKSLGLEFHNTLFCVKASSPTVWSRTGGGLPLDNHYQMMIGYMERRCMELADVAISGSLHLLRWMLDHGYNLPQGRCHVQPNIMGTDTLPTVGKSHKIGDRVPVDEIVFFGRLEARKGLHIFC